MGILIGALFGLAMPKPLSVRTQVFFRSALGACHHFLRPAARLAECQRNFFAGVEATVHCRARPNAGVLDRQTAAPAKISNRLGRHAGHLVASASSGAPRKIGDGFTACAILFCAAPLGLLGAVTDGLPPMESPSGGFLAAGGQSRDGWSGHDRFRENIRLAVRHVGVSRLAFLGGITFACQFYAKPFLAAHGLVDPVNAAAGLIACAIALMIFEVRRVELANFLPALAVAPLLAWWLK
jgi:uncharacterized membrane protein YqgA involved in biofilm formation